jgi:hypothetical protein
MIKNKIQIFVTCFLLLISMIFLYSCKIGYSFTGASIAPDVKTVSIKTFQNVAPLAQPTLSQTFTESLKDIFLTQTNLSLVEKGGDLHFEGKITGYSVAPVAIQGNQVSTASLNRLTITVQVKFINTKDEKQNFEQSFSRFADFDASRNLASVENELTKDINSQLSQDIFNKAVTNW